jgi:hypothetical protein
MNSGSYMNSLLNESSSGTSDFISRLFASTLVGYQAQGGNPTFSNTFVGYQAGLGSLATSSIGIGVSVAINSSNNVDNIVIGNLSGMYTASANRNVILGNAAANALQGDENVLIGYKNSDSANTSQSVSIGCYTTVNGTCHVNIGASNAGYGSSNTITLGSHIMESNCSCNITIGNNITNTGNRCLFLNTRRPRVEPLVNTQDDVINIQDRVLGSNNNSRYAMKLVADSVIVQTVNGDIDLLAGGGNTGGQNIHHIIGSCKPIEQVYEGVDTTFPETVVASKDFIVEGELLVMGGICYGGIVSPNHIFDGNVSLCNDLLVRGNATFCNDVYLFNNSNLSSYLDKITQIGAFFDDNVSCGDPNTLYDDVGITFEDSVRSMCNMIIDGKLHVKGGICFGGLHAVQEPLWRTAHQSFGGFPYSFGVNPFLQTIDVMISFEAVGTDVTLELLLYGQSCALVTTSIQNSSQAIFEASIIKKNQTEGHVAVRVSPSGYNSIVVNSNVININWNSTQEVRVRSVGTGSVTGHSFRVTVSS